MEDVPRDKPRARGRFKGFMKSLTKDSKLYRRSSSGALLATPASRQNLQLEGTGTSTAASTNDNTSSINGVAAPAAATAASSTSAATTAAAAGASQSQQQRPAPLPKSPEPEPLGAATELAIHVSLTFEEPLDFSFSRIYEGSPAFRASDAVCQGLLRRVDHCCQELITRKDPVALDRTNANDGTGKPLRFEICTDIIRGSETWASRTYKSYQKQPLTGDTARDVTLSAHQIIGLFMRQHDDGFVWKDGPFRDDTYSSQPHDTFPYRPGRVQALTCVPRNLFLEKPQEFEKLPGYTVQIEITSQNHLPKPREWHRLVEINSTQSTPLDMPSAEDLFFDTSFAMEGILHKARRDFAARHSTCSSAKRCARCRPHEGDGLELKMTVTNNIGPRFDHLQRTIKSNLGGFLVAPDSAESTEFVDALESACHQLRDEVDLAVSRRNDLEFSITELRGRGWTLDEPLNFTIGPESSFCRRDTEAILDRVQTGLASVLRGNALKVRMTAHKRGHFIMDKTLVAREPFEPAATGRPGHLTKRPPKPTDKTKEQVVELLQKQINKDIEMICLDTCTVVEEEEEIETTPLSSGETSDAAQDTDATDIPLEERISTLDEPSEAEQKTGRAKRANTMGSLLSMEELMAAANVTPSDIHEPAQADGQRPSLARRTTREVRDRTGARMFPLVPQDDKYSGVDDIALDLPEDGGVSSSTPSLDSGDGASAPSSVLVTPRSHEHQSEVHSTTGKSTVRDSAEYKLAPSPLHHEDTAQTSAGSSTILITSPNDNKGPDTGGSGEDGFAQSKPDFDFSSPTPISPLSVASDRDVPPVPALALDTSSQRPARMSRIELHKQEQERDGLPVAKTRESDTNGNDINDDLDDGVDDNEEAVESEPPSPVASRPSTSAGLLGRSVSGGAVPPPNRPPHQHRKSLGSAGFLGSFHNDRVADIIGLRKALMLSSPSNANRDSSVPPVPPLPQHLSSSRSLSVDSTMIMFGSDAEGQGQQRPGTSGGATSLKKGGAGGAEDDDDDDGGVSTVSAFPAAPASVNSNSTCQRCGSES